MLSGLTAKLSLCPTYSRLQIAVSRIPNASFDAGVCARAAVAAQPVTDTIKESEDGQTISSHPDRGRLWAVQTPQTFRVAVIRQALTTAKEKGLNLTDDTAACALIGQPVRLVHGDTPNPKVTVPADLPYIERLLQERARARGVPPA